MELFQLIPKKWAIKESARTVTIGIKSNKRNSNSKLFEFPKYINLDSVMAEAIGLILGDGDMHRKEKAHLTFCSIDIDIAVFVIEFFRSHLLLQNKDITIYIPYREKFDINLIASNLNYPVERIKTRYSERHKYPAIHIQINGVVFRLVFEKLVQEFLKSFIEKPELRRGFLRGLFAAEGCVAIDYQENYLDHLCFSLSAINEQELAHVLHIALKKEKIAFTVKTQNNCIVTVIQNWRNYLLCWQMRLFDLCGRKKLKFLSIAKQRKVYCVIAPSDLKKLRRRFTQRELAQLIGSWQGNVCKMLHGNILFSLKQIRLLEKRGYPITIEKLRIGSTTELPYSKETVELFA